jgi:hypothetical protein
MMDFGTYWLKMHAPLALVGNSSALADHEMPMTSEREKVVRYNLRRGEKIMDEILKWAEQGGAENMKFHAQTAEQLAKDANTTLTLLLAGVGGSLAIVAKVLETQPHQSPSVLAGAGAMAVWFMVLAALVLHWCIQTRSFPAPTNEPKNLYQIAYPLTDLRQWELQNLQERIEQLTKRNDDVAKRLDLIRYASAGSPVVFLISVLAAARLPSLFVLG